MSAEAAVSGQRKPTRSSTASSSTASTPPRATLADQLPWVAGCVQAVGAGRNIDAALAKTPSELRAGVQALAYSVLRQWAWAHAVLPTLAKKSPAVPVRALLLSCVALLRQPSGYASHVVVDEAVKACKASHKLKAAAGFINGSLRTLLRDYDAIDTAAMSDWVVAFNHPIWWIKRLRSQYPDHWQDMLRANQRAAPMVLRVNAQRHSRDDYIAQLQAAGMGAQALLGAGAAAVVLDKPQPVYDLPGFEQGDVSVQDGSPQLAAHYLWQSPHLQRLVNGACARAPLLLDACAAPGGKTAHVLEAAPASCAGSDIAPLMTALEIDETRAQRIHGTLQRLGLQATVVVADAAQRGIWCDSGPFDAILLDAPCTASGIVRRHPDVPWLRRESDIDQLVAQQRDLLEALWPQLVPGGRMVYCTCSTFKEEGQWQIEGFLQRHPEAQLVPSVEHIVPGDVDGRITGQVGPTQQSQQSQQSQPIFQIDNIAVVGNADNLGKGDGSRAVAAASHGPGPDLNAPELIANRQVNPQAQIGHNQAMGFDGFFYAVLDKAS
jgi:16S rRNA (cytosine967-C5)-methyltransferase